MMEEKGRWKLFALISVLMIVGIAFVSACTYPFLYVFHTGDVNYMYNGVVWIWLIGFFALVLTGVLFPWRRLCHIEPAKKMFFRLPFEFLVFLGCCIFGIMSSGNADYFYFLMQGDMVYDIQDMLQIPYTAAWWVGLFGHFAVLCFLFAGALYLGLCGTDMRTKGFIEYIKEHSLIYRFFPFVKRKFLALYDEAENMDITKDGRKIIWKIVIWNGLAVCVMAVFWPVFWILFVVYLIGMYLILKSYISKIQKNYSLFLSKCYQISKGNLNVSMMENMGVFEPMKLQLLRIQDGFRGAVEQEVKSERMKAELVANVSHDLKTPLTAIITYVNLLKEENISEQQRKEYLDTLERKSLRLKSLIEDLFEVSKANTGNVTMNFMDVDICNLLKQVIIEFEDKMRESNLEIRCNLPEEKVICTLDSQKTYRVYENLLNNIAKYSLPGSRVYIEAKLQGEEVVIEMKNISATELLVRPEELTERFVRGDASRNTEGSGLGLAIAKSFVELQGGSLKLQIDGDLFKVVTRFAVKP